MYIVTTSLGVISDERPNRRILMAKFFVMYIKGNKMSRIGKNPVVIPNDVKIELKDIFYLLLVHLVLSREFPAKVK